ncbi:TadE/TadG family type IV pilus assembly protein [Histidinibacterium aquaticum]|uniref:VWA domain-containing protein n=1 Tax=Histidinibacterium aquaticum TaxID=2613962 RepID=A0A5J5GPE7_9RHOB|nr:TadE/TadG family type IV pilus assembly protein [Histidinibacterium aquaticum]KAA9010256.1 VWA domain-containing protein [Histidinibacterium aquaticum]
MPPLPASRPRLRGPVADAVRRLRQMRRDEHGGMIIFSLFIFVVMLLIAGLAVDLLRTETTRTRLQGTLDRAVLAAADLDQELDPEAVVRDYVAKAGLSDHLVEVTVSNDSGSRVVGARARADVLPFFSHMVGLESFPAPAASMAGETVNKIEVSLVLDISASMQGTKIAELRDAAKQFAGTLIGAMGEERISVNLVPYSTQVAAPTTLFDLFGNIARQHGYSSCATMAGADYGFTSLLGIESMTQTQHFDPWTMYGPLYGTDSSDGTLVCNPHDWARAAPGLTGLETIQDRIDALQADGNTSIDIGMKWGASLLDPAMNAVLAAFQGDIGGVVQALASFDDTQVDKIIVLMTDGVNTDEYRLEGIDMTALSDIWFDELRNEMWVRAEGRWFNPRRKAYGWSNTWFDDDEWPWGTPADDNGNGYDDDGEGCGWLRPDDEWINVDCEIRNHLRQLTYGELFDRVSVRYNAYFHHRAQHGRQSDYNAWYGDLLRAPARSAKDDRLRAVCQAAKDEGITVFTVGFDLNDDQVDLMQECASTDSHYYRSANNELVETFEEIARHLTQLRLLQ